MTTITRERAQEIFLGNGPEPTASEQRELARIALASLEAETVAWTDAEELRDLRTVGFCEMFTVEPVSKDADMYRVIPLYTAPPVPVSVPDGLKQAVEFYEQVKQENIPVETGAWKDAVNWVLDEACRAAMLQDNQRDLSQPVDPQVAEYEQIMLQAGNSPVSPDGWISCSERMPAQDDWVLIYSKYGEYLAGQVQGEYVELNDGTLSWLGAALHWMPLPEPPQEVNRG
ncbi:DUF551 domain-containing protein [Salmonella enterica]|uniref:DUF551 domain-containing protein n=1 Tax=Salmonella enterica TaxID=28901 RepID=UPI000DF0A2EC|nr:DUF551 domain-containing protein [Salmonella enterica]EBQ8820308.1 DUF551 domain-containing protein [Salmonella enterica subsp. enterica serovar Kisarawe]AXD42541.1 DUF551 domain-containing protein [Salmonella enterica]EBI4956010.1 DUF551 domain-containing protein [Salmonella enterica]EBK5235836.1 DUF551 domain-containing protein [Salmonella enterica]EBL9006204.1 DUF551 domain-containing protein [Salmonella enterica]